jgi:hypothetical protein
MITEVFLEGFRVDISADESSLLTYAIDDIRDFGSRQTAFSKTIVIPGTLNNNKLFGNIFELGSGNFYDSGLDNVGYNFNASKAANCIMFQDNLQTFKGTLRLLQINKDRHNIEYEVALNGELTSLSVALSSGFLTDLDFSAYDLLWTEKNIAASWDNIPGSGVYFPTIDYGTYSANKHDWDIRTFRPALYVKEYIDKMFDAASFRYSSDLFNTDRFKRLVIPHNQKVLMGKVSTVLTSSITEEQVVINTKIGDTSEIVLWDKFIAGGFSYSAGRFTYTQPTTLFTNISLRIDGTRKAATNGSFLISLRKNGVAIASTRILTSPITTDFGWSAAVGVSIATGDIIDVLFEYGGTGTEVYVTVVPFTNMSISSNVPTLQPVDYNQTITLNDAIPQNIRQVDFLTSIVKLFNLYVYESKFDDRLIYITPFIDFYSEDASSGLDWTYKLNRDQPVQIKPMSELNSKIYNFNYKDDSDYFNDLYKKRYNQGYGSYIFDSEFDFATQENTLELIFASTPLLGYVGEDKVYPTIFKRSGTVEETIDSVIRIMQTKKIMTVAAWQIKNGATVLGSYTSYGYAGHFDSPDDPSNDLNFGVLNELFFVLVTGDITKTQFNVYWSSYMAEITDKDSKLLTAKFYLTPQDIFNLNFAKYVFIDGVLFRLNKIIDYNTTIPSDCTVELLKVINTTYTYTTYPPVADTFYWLADVDEYFINSDSSKILTQ